MECVCKEFFAVAGKDCLGLAMGCNELSKKLQNMFVRSPRVSGGVSKVCTVVDGGEYVLVTSL